MLGDAAITVARLLCGLCFLPGSPAVQCANSSADPEAAPIGPIEIKSTRLDNEKGSSIGIEFSIPINSPGTYSLYHVIYSTSKRKWQRFHKFSGVTIKFEKTGCPKIALSNLEFVPDSWYMVVASLKDEPQQRFSSAPVFINRKGKFSKAGAKALPPLNGVLDFFLDERVNTIVYFTYAVVALMAVAMLGLAMFYCYRRKQQAK
ncbi:hypothetical protein PAPHI01_2022 [Pancytospora philotis]|nr:hypothetical protein PAPHI01_2022 [Pancytospora philotis]